MSEQDSLVSSDFFESPRRRRSSGGMGCFGWGVLLVIFVVMAVVGVFLYMGKPVRDLVDGLVKRVLSAEFMQTRGEISERRDVILEIAGTHGDVLEVGTMKTTELFRKTDSRYAAWGWVYMGTATSEIRVPAVYRFHIKLSELKRARLEDGVLTVEAPPAEPSLPVAIDTSGMEKKTDGTWLRFDANQQLAELEKSITPELNARAARHLTNIRETARGSIGEFVQKWVVETDQGYRDQVKAVRIVFPDEVLETESAVEVAPLP